MQTATNPQTYRFDYEFSYTEVEGGFYYNSTDHRHSEQSEESSQLITPSLVGKHQYHNAACAIACTEQLAKAGHITMPSDATVAKAIAKTEWKARLQKLSSGKLINIIKDKNINLWLDGGHNPAAGQAIADWAKGHGIHLHLVLAMMKGKDVAGFLTPMKDVITSIHCVTIPNESGCYSSDELYNIAIQVMGADKVQVAKSVEFAIEDITISQELPKNLLIAGSLYLAGEVLKDNV